MTPDPFVCTWRFTDSPHCGKLLIRQFRNIREIYLRIGQLTQVLRGWSGRC